MIEIYEVKERINADNNKVASQTRIILKEKKVKTILKSTREVLEKYYSLPVSFTTCVPSPEGDYPSCVCVWK